MRAALAPRAHSAEQQSGPKRCAGRDRTQGRQSPRATPGRPVGGKRGPRAKRCTLFPRAAGCMSARAGPPRRGGAARPGVRYGFLPPRRGHPRAPLLSPPAAPLCAASVVDDKKRRSYKTNPRNPPPPKTMPRRRTPHRAPGARAAAAFSPRPAPPPPRLLPRTCCHPNAKIAVRRCRARHSSRLRHPSPPAVSVRCRRPARLRVRRCAIGRRRP